MNFWRCVIYLVITAVILFFVGRILPKKWFHPQRFPYRTYKFERDGEIYNHLHIHSWQNKVLDMSRIFPKLMPPKNLSGNFKERLPLMLQETCVAEFIHLLHGIFGFYCVRLFSGIGGWLIAFLNIACFNLPFILIQRYNRPRLMKLMLKRTKETN